MTNATAIYWEASGVSLQTEAWNIKTWGGSRSAPPSKRGEDFSLPFRTGRTRVSKVRDAREINLDMWILPLTPDGLRDPDRTQEQMRDANWRYLVSLMDTEDQFVLTKRWWGPDGEVLRADALAELADAPEPTSEGGYRTIATFTLALADPYFYVTQDEQPVGEIVVAGDHPTDHVRWTLASGQRVTTPDGNWVQYDGPDTAVLDVHAGTAKSGSTYVNGLVTRNVAFPTWPRLRPGPTSLTGDGSVEYDAAYW